MQTDSKALVTQVQDPGCLQVAEPIPRHERQRLLVARRKPAEGGTNCEPLYGSPGGIEIRTIAAPRLEGCLLVEGPTAVSGAELGLEDASSDAEQPSPGFLRYV